LLEFEFSCSNKAAASLILFFAATSNDNGSLFDLNQPPRGGKPENYFWGSLNCYAITCVFSEKSQQEVELKAELWQNYGKHLLKSSAAAFLKNSVWPASVQVLKLDEQIELHINKKQILSWRSSKKMHGRMLNTGFIGFGSEQQNHLITIANPALWQVFEKR
jgi:hypothetical protein